jgi:hypothetical protein
MLPFIQCHQVCGLAEFGGLRNPVSSELVEAWAAVKAAHSQAEHSSRRSNFMMLIWKTFQAMAHSAAQAI